LTWATSAGGKTARAARALAILKPFQPLVVEASSPAPDNDVVHVQAPGDLDVGEPVSGVEDELGALHQPVRQRVARRPMLELRTLLVAHNDPIAIAARHRRHDSRPAT
jgi:hypothetical protein